MNYLLNSILEVVSTAQPGYQLTKCENECYDQCDIRDERNPDDFAFEEFFETFLGEAFFDDFRDDIFELFDGNPFDGDGPGTAATVSTGSVGIATLATFTPPPLAMFPPVGLPQPVGLQPGTLNIVQPGTSLAGGGALPAAALTVSNTTNLFKK